MVRILLVVILAVTCFACKKSSNDHCEPETFEFKFQDSMNIDTTRIHTTDPTLDYYSYTKTAGNKTVFTYKHHFRDCPEIADDEGLKIIIFEVPEQSGSFFFNDSIKLHAAKTLIHYSCFCAPGTPVLIKQGFIEGIKVSANAWKITANLQNPWNPQETVIIDRFFMLQ